MKKSIWLSVAMVAALASGVGRAQEERGPGPEGGMRGPRPGGGGMREMRGPGPAEEAGLAGLRELDLTPEQREQAVAAVKAGREESRALMERMRVAREKQMELIHADTFDEGAIRAAVQETAKIEEELAVMRAKSAQAVRAILTPEQQAKLKDLRKEARGRMREGVGQRLENRRQERQGKGKGPGDEAPPPPSDRLP